MGFQNMVKGALPHANDIQQLINVFTALRDAGALAFLGPVAAPTSAPSVTLSSGGLNGSYQWGTYWITGIENGSGGFNVSGRTTPSPYSAAQTLTNQEGTVSIAGETIPTGVVGWGVVRNQAGGSTWYEVPGSEQFLNGAGSMPTTYVDNTADANLVTAAPSSNTTGTFFSYLTVLQMVVNGSATFNSQTTFASGLSSTELSVTGMTGAQTQSRYVGAVSGGAPTTGTFDVRDFVLDVTNLTLWICTAAGSPGTWSNFNYLRLDANAPNPQTVANPVDFSNLVKALGGLGTTATGNGTSQGANSSGIFFGWNESATKGEGDIFVYGQGGTGGFRVYNTNNTSYPTFTEILGVDGSGNGTFPGTVTASSGQLGSASGTWTPASGTFNVAAGTVINVASVPSGAKNYFVNAIAGTVDINNAWGIETSAGSVWQCTYSGGTTAESVYGGYAAAISSTTMTGEKLLVYDGTYKGYGYFQINGGYLQFVAVEAGTASTNAQNTFGWGVA